MIVARGIRVTGRQSVERGVGERERKIAISTEQDIGRGRDNARRRRGYARKETYLTSADPTLCLLNGDGMLATFLPGPMKVVHL